MSTRPEPHAISVALCSIWSRVRLPATASGDRGSAAAGGIVEIELESAEDCGPDEPHLVAIDEAFRGQHRRDGKQHPVAAGTWCRELAVLLAGEESTR
jgi:hypothetical protein